MTDSARSRRLEDLIGDLASSVLDVAPSEDGASRSIGIHPVSVEFDLPIETRVAAEPGELVVRADFPQTRTRTPFDRPLGRLSIRLAAEVGR